MKMRKYHSALVECVLIWISIMISCISFGSRVKALQRRLADWRIGNIGICSRNPGYNEAQR